MLSAAADEARDARASLHQSPSTSSSGCSPSPTSSRREALAELGVTAPVGAARLVAQRLGTGAPRPTGSLGVAPQTKRLLELARAIAKSLGNRCPKTEHILLAATSPKLHSPAAELLADCGATP